MAILPPSPAPSDPMRTHLRRISPDPDTPFQNHDDTHAVQDTVPPGYGGVTDANSALLRLLCTGRSVDRASWILLQATSAKERRALARRLHDDLGQTMFVLRMEVDHLADLHTQRAAESVVHKSIEAVRGSLDDALRLVRTLCAELRDTGDGLLELTRLIEPTVHALARRGHLTSRVLTTGGRIQIEGRRALLVTEVCREAVTNVLRHAGASTVTVRIMRRGAYFSVSIRDDGKGFRPEALESRDAFGVMGMRERAQVLGGSLNITREDGHTVVSLSAPLRATNTSAVHEPGDSHD
jgi:signal transduction histidine kinase